MHYHIEFILSLVLWGLNLLNIRTHSIPVVNNYSTLYVIGTFNAHNNALYMFCATTVK